MARRPLAGAGHGEQDVDRARRVGAIVAHRVHRGDVVPVDGTETVNAFGERWCDWREERGLSSAGENRSQLRVHLGPAVGSLPMQEVTRERLEDFVRKMDERVRNGEINWKTAINVCVAPSA